MDTQPTIHKQSLPGGVMLNAYPDSIGGKLADLVAMLKRPELEGAFSLLYILPTFFNSDLDRGFSIVDYGLNDELVSRTDLDELDKLKVMFKFDLILNHLSVASPQFRDLLEHGDNSAYKDFFVDWNAFWEGQGEMGEDGCVVPYAEHLNKLFLRKPGLPILKVGFPDGSERPYWNTFYQQVSYKPISAEALSGIDGLSQETAAQAAAVVNTALETETDLERLDLKDFSHLKDQILPILERNREYLGQMDLNANSEQVWAFYDETLRQLSDYGAKIIRLDAFAYLHKRPGEPNFFNKPGTWDYLERLKGIASKYDLIIFPEVHAEYGKGLHEEVASKGFPIYDFFFPGLVLDAWRDAGVDPVPVAVNVSAVQLIDGHFPGLVKATLEGFAIPPRLLILELTETAIVEDETAGVLALERLAQLGVCLHMDDFGTGWSSLGMLRKLPFNTVKIDRGFVTDIANSDADALLVAGIIQMAHSLNKAVVAEGVETDAQLARLRDYRCDAAQGWLFGYPEGPAQIEQRLRDRKALG